VWGAAINTILLSSSGGRPINFQPAVRKPNMANTRKIGRKIGVVKIVFFCMFFLAPKRISQGERGRGSLSQAIIRALTHSAHGASRASDCQLIF
jgi:hypothetical protein